MRYFVVLFISMLMISSCKRAKSNVQAETEKVISFQIYNGDKAKTAISTDVKESYFDQVRSLEMSVQMSEVLAEDAKHEEVHARYLDYLKNDVDEFNAEDKELIAAMEDTLNILLKNIKKAWLKQDIYLVKLKENCYGPGVFYTRDNGIFIPYGQLDGAEVGDLLNVFLHEIFHIMSRYNEDFRRGAYSLIGFEAVEGKLDFPADLDRRIFLNPDGVNMAYSITLENEDKDPIRAIPVIHSNSPNYSDNKPSFFGYIQFDLFRITENNGEYEVHISEEIGQMVTPEIPDNYYPSFFEQIGDNTQYIIHPDEIMADNFMFAIFAQNNIETMQFSEKGTELLERFQNLIFVE